MGKWINANDRMPKVEYNEGDCNGVLVWWAMPLDGGFQYGISNTAYLHKNPHTITHWMPLPLPPE